jgi:hypothetical protein
LRKNRERREHTDEDDIPLDDLLYCAGKCIDEARGVGFAELFYTVALTSFTPANTGIAR